MSGLGPRPLGRTGLSVSALCAGTSGLGSIPEIFGYEVPEERALATLRAVFAGPITFVDTASGYGRGESERRIGLLLRELGGLPEGWVLATKVGQDWETGAFDGAWVRRCVEASRARLGLDRLQLVYLHDPQETTFEAAMAPGGPVEALRQLRDEGVIEHIGVAGGPVALMIRFIETEVFEVAITHNRWTLVDRSAEPLLEVAGARGVAVVNGAPYGGGVLARGSGAFPRYGYRALEPPLRELVQQVEALCQEHGVPLAAAALQLSLQEPRIISTIAGMSRPERVRETMELAATPIPDELWARLRGLALTSGDPGSDRW